MRYLYNSRGDSVHPSNVGDPKVDLKGKTLDGDAVYHIEYFDKARQKYISYDTVMVKGEHRYIVGSGQERNHNSSGINKWDAGGRVTWQEALSRRTHTLFR